MIKYEVKQKITIDIGADHSEDLADYLNKHFKTSDFEPECDLVIYTEEGIRDFYPGVRYTMNGDGYPDDWEDHFKLCSDDIYRVVEVWAQERNIEYYDVSEEEIECGDKIECR